MKKYLTLFFFSAILGVGLVSCEGDDPVTYRYTLENQSGVPIQLKLYSMDKERGLVSVPTYIYLENGEKMVKKEKMYPPSISYNFVDFFRQKEGNPNTLEVMYSNQKKTVYFQQHYTSVVKNTCVDDFGNEVPCDPRNILNTFIYRNVTEHYIFTAEDYQQAEDCKGDCE